MKPSQYRAGIGVVVKYNFLSKDDSCDKTLGIFPELFVNG